MGAIGYSLVAIYSAQFAPDAQRTHTYLLAGAALGCWLGYLITHSGRALLGGSIAMASLWVEIHLSFVIAPTIPSPGLLASPLLAMSAGLLYGSRISLITAVASVLVTTPLYLLSPAATPEPFGREVNYWLVVHGAVTIASWALISQSLSAIRQTLRTLTERDAELAALINEAPDGILVVNSSDDVHLANPSAERILGAPGLSVGGAKLTSVLVNAGAGDASQLATLLAQETSGDASGPVQWELQREGAPTVHVEVTQRGARGERRQLMLRDVTQRVRAAQTQRAAEQQLAHAQRLESVGRLAGGIAHDFNNLLLAIGGNAELLREALSEEERITLLDELESAQERGAVLARQLLAFARRDIQHATVFELGTLTVDIQRLLRHVAGESVHLRCITEGDTRVLADRVQMEQVLLNLIANARDAMPEGGVCTVTVTGPVETTSAARVRVAVTDTGLGMDPQTQARAFEPFFTTKARGRGTGLGLSSVHGIVTQCGGEVTIDSSPDRGTTVTVDLPHNAEPVSLAGASRVNLPPRAPSSTDSIAHILVADDDDSTRAVVGRVLLRAGYSTTLVPDGDEALRALKSGADRISLIITDVVMPVMSGPALASRVQNEYPDIPVLFMSGYPEVGFEEFSDFDAERDLLAKPFASAELLRRVREKLVTRALPE